MGWFGWGWGGYGYGRGRRGRGRGGGWGRGWGYGGPGFGFGLGWGRGWGWGGPGWGAMLGWPLISSAMSRGFYYVGPCRSGLGPFAFYMTPDGRLVHAWHHHRTPGSSILVSVRVWVSLLGLDSPAAYCSGSWDPAAAPV